ncbi:DUF6378 domain-containing protein [Sulfurivirga sp.]|uniref:DUF6378 domain-containing protein n=1 Tax=Sulfurivirga sp. TaxID=2614236 RepID=UPI0025FC7108|nr:DUF6378 domain-containing protein [Sulfurivirga sp.]
MNIRWIVDQRGSLYGRFDHGARIMQRIKQQMRTADGWQRLAPDQQEALEMIAHKIGRILNGDPNHVDSWVDIAGYATLIVNKLEGGNEA